MEQKRYKSIVLISGLATLLVHIIKNKTGYQLDSEFANELVNYICYIIWGLVMANNPSLKDKF